MPAQVIVCHKWAKVPDQGQSGVEVVDTTSKADDWRRDLSPFHLGPCQLINGMVSQNMENAWQYSKVYKEDVNEHGEPTQAYWDWAKAGWANPIPRRYPKGKGRAPLYSLWGDAKLSYIQARKRIYGPLYAQAVMQTEGFRTLQGLYEQADRLYLRDWDGWDMQRHGMRSLSDVLNNPNRKMGHAFVLQMILTKDRALLEFES